MMLMRFKPRPLRSLLSGVSDEAWTKFVRVLDVQDSRAVSSSGGLGSYDIRPRRLVELELATNLRVERTEEGRQVWRCDLGPKVERFLFDPGLQLWVLDTSMVEYHKQLERPDGVSLAGALAILHRGGRGALRGWPKLFSDTKALYDMAQGAF